MLAGPDACHPCAPIRRDHFSCFASYGLRRVGALDRFHGAYEVTRVTSHCLSPPSVGDPSSVVQTSPAAGVVISALQFHNTGRLAAGACPCNNGLHTRVLFSAVPL